MPARLSADEKLIARLRRTQRRRRPLGIFCVVVGVLGAALALFGVNYLHHYVLGVLNGIAHLAPPDPQQIESLNRMHYNFGFALGAFFFIWLTGAINFAALGLRLLFGNRKDRLLLQCWDNQHPIPSDRPNQE